MSGAGVAFTRGMSAAIFVKRHLAASQVRRNMAASGAANLLRAATVAATFPLCLRFIGYEEYGLWLTASTILSVAQFSTLGMSPAVTRFVAESVAQRQLRRARGYAMAAMIYTAVAGGALTLAVFAARNWLVCFLNVPQSMQAAAQILFPGAAALSVFTLLLDIEQAHLAGLGRADLSAASQLGGRLLALLLSAAFLAVGMRVWGLFAANVVASCFAHFLLRLFIARAAPNEATEGPLSDGCRKEIARNLLSFGTSVAASNSLMLLLHPLNKYVLGRHAGFAVVSIYEIAVAGNMQLRGIIEASIRPLLPEVSAVSSGGRKDASRKISLLHKNSVALAGLCGAAIFLVVIWKTALLLRLWLGAQSHESLIMPMRLYAIAAFLSLLGVPAYYCLLGLGAVRSLVVNYSLIALGNCSVLGVAVWRGGLTANTLCFGMLLGFLFSTVHMLWALRRRLSRDSER